MCYLSYWYRIFTSLSHLTASWRPLKGRAWPVHPIRLWLISLFFRVKERDEGRHWVFGSPHPFASLPSLLHPATHPPAVALSVALEELLLSVKKANTDHTLNRRAHTRAGIKTGKVSWHKALLLSGWKCHRKRVLTMRGHLKSPLTLILVNYSPLWLQTGRGKFHCCFYRLREKFLHTTVEQCLCSDVWYENNKKHSPA